MAPLEQKVRRVGRTFAQMASLACDIQLNNLPPKVEKGESIGVLISQDEHEAGLEECKCNLHGRLSLNKGDAPITTKILGEKLLTAWKGMKN